MSIPNESKRPGVAAVRRMREEIAALTKERDDYKRLVVSRQETLQGRNQEIQKLKGTHEANLAERLALAKQRDEAQALAKSRLKFLYDANDEVARLAQKMEDAFAERDAARQDRDRLQVERDRYKAEAELYQTSTNNLGAQVKEQARNGVLKATVSEDAYPGDALAEDLPSGLLSGILLSPKTIVWMAWIAAGLAFYAGWLIGGAK